MDLSTFMKGPTLADRQKERRATPKHEMVPTPVRKAEKKKLKKQLDKEFRDGVWDRDKDKCRATGKKLARSGTDYDKVGEVHHRMKRSTSPEQIYDVTIGVLLSKTMHRNAETVCPGDPEHCLLDIVDLTQGDADMGKPHLFIQRDKDGKELRRRIS